MEDNALKHHGVKGQRWGVRRYQNKDGTLTNEGKKRYSQLVNDVRGNLSGYISEAEKKYFGSKEHDAIRAKQKEETDRVHSDPKYQTDISRRFDEAGKRHTDALEKARNGKTFLARRQGKKELRDANRQLTKAFDEWTHDAETQKRMAEADKVTSKILDKYYDKQASLLLKELGYEDTKKAREFIMNDIIDFENVYYS